MARVAGHLSVEDLEAGFRSARNPTAVRHFQVIWLLARGHTIADVAAVTSFGPRWIEQLLARYNAKGPEALGDLRRRNGSAPSVLRPALLERLRARLEAPPPDGGLWSSRKVAAWMAGELGLAALFGGAVGKDVVSRVWRKVKTDWDAWTRRDPSAEPIIRLILDGTVVRVRLDRKATAISLLVVLGVRQDGQKVLLAVKNMGGESEAAWRAILDDLVARGLRTPEFVIVDGAPGLEKALAALWPDVPAQRCTVHKHRNLLAHAPDRLHEEVSADYTDMIYAASAAEVAERRRAFLRKWRP